MIPTEIREVLDVWKTGRISRQTMLDASMKAAYASIESYRWHPLPIAPPAVMEYHHLSEHERGQIDRATKTQLYTKYHDFFVKENRVKQDNESNAMLLRDLLDWAVAQHVKPAAIAKIRSVLATHEAISRKVDIQTRAVMDA